MKVCALKMFTQRGFRPGTTGVWHWEEVIGMVSVKPYVKAKRLLIYMGAF